MDNNIKPISSIWVIIALIFFFPLGLILMWAKINWTNRSKWVVTIVFAAIIVISLISNATYPSKVSQQTKKEITPTAVQKITKKPTTEHTSTSSLLPKGLGITRKYMIDSLNKGAEAADDSDFQFKQGVDVNGKDNYIAQQGQNLVQLIGPSDNLTEVGTTAILGDSTGDNMIALVYIIGAANLVDPHSLNWVTGVMKDAGNTTKDSQKWSTTIDDKKYEIDMETIGNLKTFTLQIDPL